MRIALCGCGKMGRAVALDCLGQADLVELRLADADPERLTRLSAELEDSRVNPRELNAADTAAVRDFATGCAVLVSAVSYRFNPALARAAVDAGCHFIDMGGNNDAVARELALDGEARRAGVTLVPDMGLAPGLVNVLTRSAFERLGGLDEARLYVGGLPRNPRGEWRYEAVFSATGLINEYREPCLVLREGEPRSVESLSEVERLNHPVLGELEAFHTSGGSSTLPVTYAGRVRTLEYKTLRYPGHARLVRALFELGLDDEEPVELGGCRVRPRDLLEERIGRRLAPVGEDLVVLTARFRGPDGALRVELLDYADAVGGLSAMMRCTGFPVAVTAQLLARGEISVSGAQTPEHLPPRPILAGLAERGLELSFHED